MGFNVSVREIITSGGPTLAFLILLSIYSVALIWERFRFFRRQTSGLKPFLNKIRRSAQEGNFSEAITLCHSYQGSASLVVMASLVGPTGREERKRSAERATERAVTLMQNRITTLGTIASTAPFIGLLGTVVGVMRAFRDLAGAAGAGPGVVAIGISEALVCTAAGLLVAIPAVFAYNYFNQQAARFADEMNWLSEEILENLSKKPQK